MGKSDFESAGEEAQPGFFREFLEFLGSNKKWWMLPIIVVLLLFGLLIILGGTPAGPWIYTLF